MRQYRIETKDSNELEKVICNKCGKEMEVIKGVSHEDFLQVEKRWGYGSRKDNEVDSFELCEDCYDELVESFRIKIRD